MGVTPDLVAGTRALLASRNDATASEADQVLDLLAAFRADPCGSGWYGFVVKLGLLVEPSEVHGLVGEMDPYPGITIVALADAGLARRTAAGRDVD
jgi:hypothetical protein